MAYFQRQIERPGALSFEGRKTCFDRHRKIWSMVRLSQRLSKQRRKGDVMDMNQNKIKENWPTCSQCFWLRISKEDGEKGPEKFYICLRHFCAEQSYMTYTYVPHQEIKSCSSFTVVIWDPSGNMGVIEGPAAISYMAARNDNSLVIVPELRVHPDISKQ